MRKTIFDIVAEQDDAIRKEAFLVPAVARAAMGAGKLLAGTAGKAGKFMVTKPGMAVGAAFTGAEYASGAKRFSNVTRANRMNPYKPPSVD